MEKTRRKGLLLDGYTSAVHDDYVSHLRAGSDQVRRNGSKNGQPKYQCTACRHQGLFVPAAVRKAAQYAQVDACSTSATPSTALSGSRAWPG